VWVSELIASAKEPISLTFKLFLRLVKWKTEFLKSYMFPRMLIDTQKPILLLNLNKCIRYMMPMDLYMDPVNGNTLMENTMLRAVSKTNLMSKIKTMKNLLL